MNKRLVSLALCLAILLTTGCSKGGTTSSSTSAVASSTVSEPVEATTAGTTATTAKPAIEAEVWTGTEFTDPLNQAKFDVLVSRVATDLMSRGIILKDVTEDELTDISKNAEDSLNDITGSLSGGIFDTPEESTPVESTTSGSEEATSAETTTTVATTAAPKLTEAEKLAKKQEKLLSGSLSYIKKTFAKVSHVNSDEYREAYDAMIEHFAASSISTSDLASYLASYLADKCDQGAGWVSAFDRIADVMSGTKLDCLAVTSGIYKNDALPIADADWLNLYQATTRVDSTSISVGDMPIGQGANIDTFRNAYNTARDSWGVTGADNSEKGSVTGIYFGTHQFRMPYIYETEAREVPTGDKGKTKVIDFDVTDYYSKDFQLSADKTHLDGNFVCSDIGQLTVMNLFTTITDNLTGAHSNLIAYMRDNMSDVYDKYEALSKKYAVKTATPTTPIEGTTPATDTSSASDTSSAPEDTGIGGDIVLGGDIPVSTGDTDISETPDIGEGVDAPAVGTTGTDTLVEEEPEEDLPYGDLFKSTTLTADNESKIWVDFVKYLKKDMSKKEYIGAWDELCSIVDLDTYSFVQLVNLFAVSSNTSCGTYRMDLDSGLKATIYYDGNGLSSYDWYLQIPLITNTLTMEQLRSVLLDYVMFLGGFTGESYGDALDTAISGAVNRVNLGEYAVGIDYFTYAGAIITIAKG